LLDHIIVMRAVAIENCHPSAVGRQAKIAWFRLILIKPFDAVDNAKLTPLIDRPRANSAIPSGGK
jgi:hypothetical protein